MEEHGGKTVRLTEEHQGYVNQFVPPKLRKKLVDEPGFSYTFKFISDGSVNVRLTVYVWNLRTSRVKIGFNQWYTEREGHGARLIEHLVGSDGRRRASSIL